MNKMQLAMTTALAFAVVAQASAAYSGPPPNIIFVLADDQGWGDVGYNPIQYQNEAYQYNWTFNPPQTPNLNAFANSENSILFHRFYAGSGVCSPTRSALLTGRTPDRECITSAEGCGQQPAWKCKDSLPLPPETFTIAEAAKKANYSTIHIGKWHLGDFFYKGDDERERYGYHSMKNTKGGFAYSKWPVSNPGMHGFDEWHSTEASAASSTTNCGCVKAWADESPGCIVGGGEWEDKALECTNYWSPLDLDSHHVPSRAACRNEYNGTYVLAHDCVGNYTEKIVGDDSAHIMDVFEDFLTRKVSPGPEKSPFMAVLWLHTVHEPHPSLPEFYHAYNDSFGDWAGDYLGTITQMDVQIGRLRQMLKDKNVADNTMVWYTADNGPHSGGRDKNQYDALGATNGLRQCKASLYEGGIRVPGILEWPAMIKSNSMTWHPAYVSDYLPTILEILDVSHGNPGWAKDGMSLLPLINQLATSPAANDTSRRPDENPLVFRLGGQHAIINNQWKILANPVAGQCDSEKGSVYKGTMLFNLDTDPTESADLSKDPQYAGLVANFTKQLAALDASILFSSVNESQCAEGGPPGPSPGPNPSPPSPVPPIPPATGSSIMQAAKCLTVDDLGSHPNVYVGACDGGSKWVSTDGSIANVAVEPTLNYLKIAFIKWNGDCTSKTLAAPVTTGKFEGDNFFSFKDGNLVGKCDGTPVCLASVDGKAVASPCSAANVTWSSNITAAH